VGRLSGGRVRVGLLLQAAREAEIEPAVPSGAIADQHGNLFAQLIEKRRWKSGSCENDRTRERVDAPDVARENFTRHRQSFRQDHAGREGPDPGGHRTNNEKAARHPERPGRNDNRRTATALFTARARIEVDPYEMTFFRFVGSVRHSTISRPMSGPQSKASLIASGVMPARRSSSL